MKMQPHLDTMRVVAFREGIIALALKLNYGIERISIETDERADEPAPVVHIIVRCTQGGER